MLRLIGSLLALALTTMAAPPTPKIPPSLAGHFFERVICQADATQAYALYVPSSYVPTKSWPVIFCFDPGARGRVPVERLKAAAEKYGYIVAGSLNSRNGPWAANEAAIEAMVRDVSAHLALDRQRIYAAGLSGGARVAVHLAMTGLAKGVIACSAGFPVSDEDIPWKISFAFFGTAGVNDFNYNEIKRLDDMLDERRAAHRVVFFEGGHEWAPEALLSEAVEWLELQAMRTGTTAKNEALIRAAYQGRVAAMPAEPAGEKWRATHSLIGDFSGLMDVTEWEARAKALASSREVKEWRKSERARLRREQELASKLGNAAESGAWKRVRQIAAELHEKSADGQDAEEARMARRVLAGFAMNSREATRGLFDAGNYADAAALLEMLAEVSPGKSRTLYDLARARASSGDRSRALEALRQAAAVGLSDAVRVEAEPAFAKFKGDAEFNAVLATIRANPAEPDRPWRGRP